MKSIHRPLGFLGYTLVLLVSLLGILVSLIPMKAAGGLLHGFVLVTAICFIPASFVYLITTSECLNSMRKDFGTYGDMLKIFFWPEIHVNPIFKVLYLVALITFITLQLIL